MNRPHYAPGDTVYWFDYTLMSVRGAIITGLLVSHLGNIEYVTSDGARLDGYATLYKSVEAALRAAGTPELNQR